jgi:hypothetical protein
VPDPAQPAELSATCSGHGIADPNGHVLVVLAGPQRAGVVLHEHAERVAEAAVECLIRVRLHCARGGAVDHVYRGAAEVHGAILTGSQVPFEASVVDRDVGAALSSNEGGIPEKRADENVGRTLSQVQNDAVGALALERSPQPAHGY